MQLDAKTTALILIDLQRGVLAMPLAPHSAATVYERSMRLADRFRAASGLVVRIRVSFSRDLAEAPRSPVDQPMKYEALPPSWDSFPNRRIPHAARRAPFAASASRWSRLNRSRPWTR
jgi:nicotinamidase-related amidase